MQTSEQIRKENDVIIIGSGIIGSATAYYLSKRGLRVSLFEKGRLAWEQSSRNWGFVRKQNRGPVETPIAVMGHHLWRELSAELEADTEWVEGGGLSLARTEEEMEPYGEAREIARQYGVDSRILNRKEIEALVPGIQGCIVGGLYTASDGMAHPLKTTLAFCEAAQRLGAHLHTYTPVEGLIVEGEKLVGVRTPKGEARAAYTVCAAGIFSRKLARMVGLNLPVRAIRESVAATVPMAPLTNLAVFGRDVCFRQINNGQVFLSRTNLGSADFDVTLESFRNIRYFLPIFWKYKDLFRVHVGRPLWEDILRAMPWSETRSRPFDYAVDLEPEVNQKTIEACRRAFMAHFPALGDVALQETWAGVIDSTPDLLPVVGPVEKLPGIFFATGFSGHGFGLGPPMGYLLAEWLTEGKPSLDLRKLRFERFEERDFKDRGKIG